MGILEGKAAVVTGAGRGIGKGHCVHLAQNGASVVVNDIDLEEAEKVVAEIKAAGGNAIANNSNIGSREGCEKLVADCIEAFGKIDIAVNNAGVVRDKTLLKLTDEDFDFVWLIHVKGTFWVSQAAALAMKDQGTGGSIVNTSSGAHFGSFGQTNYSAAKGAIASMTYTWAMELAKYGVRVNAIGPLGTTRMSETFAGADKMPYFDPANNGPIVAWLCSEEAANVTGQIFGTGGERISHMVQPHYGKTLHTPGGWSVEEISKVFPTQMPGEFGQLGMLGKPYPFHGGVKPPKKED